MIILLSVTDIINQSITLILLKLSNSYNTANATHLLDTTACTYM